MREGGTGVLYFPLDLHCVHELLAGRGCMRGCVQVPAACSSGVVFAASVLFAALVYCTIFSLLFCPDAPKALNPDFQVMVLAA